MTPFQSQDTYFASKNDSKRLIFQISITKNTPIMYRNAPKKVSNINLTIFVDGVHFYFSDKIVNTKFDKQKTKCNFCLTK